MSATVETLSPSVLERLRRRTVVTLAAGVAIGSTGHIAAVTTATIAAEELAGSSTWAGVPGAAVVFGAAAGAATLSHLMTRVGRRSGLVTGYLTGFAGALLATVAIVAGTFPLFLVAMLLIGVANSANQLSRYVAADLVPSARRASTIGVVIWGTTIGAVVGPNAVAPAGAIGVALGLPELAGAYLFPSLMVLIAAMLAFALLRPDPYLLADTSARHLEPPGEGDPLRTLVRRPSVVVAIIGLIAGQVVMVLVMTMTPLHMTSHGHGLSAVGVVISAHVFGMFALSPVSGRLTDRFGSPPVMIAGLVIVGASSALSAATPTDADLLLTIPLFLLGFGWSLGFVAGSALLTRGLTIRERTRLQGWTDALIWSSAAVASLSSGIIVAAASFAALGLLGAALVVVPLWIVAARRQHLARGDLTAA
jgi:MFS family permease